MINFAAQKSQDEQQDENPFAVVDSAITSPSNTEQSEQLNPASSSTSKSDLLSDMDSNAKTAAKPTGITNDLTIRGQLPSEQGLDSPRAQLNDQVSKALSAKSKEAAEQTTQQPVPSPQSTAGFELSQIHPGIWLAAGLIVLVAVFWFNRKFLKRMFRGKRHRTKGDTFKPVTNRLKNFQKTNGASSEENSNPGVPEFGSAIVEFSECKNEETPDHPSELVESDPNNNENGVFPKTNNVPVSRTVETNKTNGAANNRLMGYSLPAKVKNNAFSDATSRSALKTSGPQQDPSSTLTAPSKNPLESNLETPDPFDGAAKEATLENTHTIVQFAELTCEITSLKESLANVKLDRDLRLQLESTQTELEQKMADLDQSRSFAEDRDAALQTSVKVQAELHSKVATLSNEFEKSQKQISELHEREQQLKNELAAERTAIIALHRMIETAETKMQDRRLSANGAILTPDPSRRTTQLDPSNGSDC